MSEHMSTFEEINSDLEEINSEPKVITGQQARRAATWFNYGTLISLVIPLPLLIFWTGLSMLVYALNKHHPNPKVGHYTQWAAYRFYGVAGATVAVGIFFPPQLIYYLVLWAVAAIVLVPWTLYDLYQINQDTWEDTVIVDDPPFEDD